MLATRAQLEKYLKTAGTVSAGAALDVELLDSLLAAASRRVEEARPERMLAIYPALDEDGLDTEDPVEVSLGVSRAGQRVFQVPDLRELTRVAVRPAGAVADELGVYADDRVIPATTYSLRRRPRELCALWINFTSAPSYVAGDELVLTGRFGPAGARAGQPLAVREDVVEAVLVWASRAYHNRTARYADTVQDPGGGVASYFRNLPPDVKQVIDSLEVPSL